MKYLDKFIMFMTENNTNLVDILFMALTARFFLNDSYILFTVCLFITLFVSTGSRRVRRQAYMRKEID